MMPLQPFVLMTIIDDRLNPPGGTHEARLRRLSMGGVHGQIWSATVGSWKGTAWDVSKGV
jgi:hypothetical protein